MVSPIMRKQMTFSFSFPDHQFGEGKKVELKLAVAKHALFDLILFFSIVLYLMVLSYACNFVGYSEAKENKEKQD